MHQLLCSLCGMIADRANKRKYVVCFQCKKKQRILREARNWEEEDAETKRLKNLMNRVKSKPTVPKNKFRPHITDGMTIKEKHEYFMELQRKEKENAKLNTR